MVVITAKDGYEGYVRACKEAPDIIILNPFIQYEWVWVSRLLKYDERFQHIKIVMITNLQAIEETYNFAALMKF